MAMKTLGSLAALGCFVGSIAGCGRPDSDGGSSGEIQLALTSVPADVLCLRVTVDGPRDVTQLFGLKAGEPAVFAMGRLPVGRATVSADAFAVPCDGVSAAAVAAYVAESAVDVRIDPVHIAK